MKQQDIYHCTYILHTRIVSDQTSVLPALHCLTGCDTTSKIGTKKAEPHKLLKHFGLSSTTSRAEYKSAEQFIVKVLRNTTKLFLQSFAKGTSHLNLPPTSDGILPHIKRTFYNTYLITSALNCSSAEAISPQQALQDNQLEGPGRSLTISGK